MQQHQPVLSNTYLASWSHSVQLSPSVMSDPLRPHGLQRSRLPCPSPTPGVYSNSCPLNPGCHPTISSSVIPFSYLHSLSASGSFPMSQYFASVAKVPPSLLIKLCWGTCLRDGQKACLIFFPAKLSFLSVRSEVKLLSRV